MKKTVTKDLLSIANPSLQAVAKGFLLLALASITIAGLYSLPPVILRGPAFKDMLPVEEIFATALVIHVDLSVLIWMLSISAIMLVLLAPPRIAQIYKTMLWLMVAGLAAMVLSSLFGDANPLKNNYVPVLQHPLFFIGLSLFTVGVLFSSVLTFYHGLKRLDTLEAFGIWTISAILLIAFSCFVLAYQNVSLPSEIGAYAFYEMLFWGGGHVLQFAFTASLLVVWLWLARISGHKLIIADKWLKAVFLLHLLFVIPSPFIYFFYESVEETVSFFTKQMNHAGGVASIIIAFVVIISLFKSKSTAPAYIKHGLLLSIALFGYGGILALLISGSNVTIPAHYHGSIVGITLAFMIFCYHLLPRFGYLEIKGKLANSQPWIYAIGQTMHITGLAWMGGYGALRKAPGTSQMVDNIPAKLMFFSGGALAIIGGVLFVVVAYRAVLCKGKN